MELSSVKHFLGKDIYKFSNGTVIKMQRGTGKVEIGEDNGIKVTGGEKLSVICGKDDDKICLMGSQVNTVSLGRGQNQLFCNGCKFNDYNMFLGKGSFINTSGNWFNSKNDKSTICINGDFKGMICAQQGSGKGWGDDSKAHADKIVITGNNDGHIKVDSHDKVAVKGERGHIYNETIYYM